LALGLAADSDAFSFDGAAPDSAFFGGGGDLAEGLAADCTRFIDIAPVILWFGVDRQPIINNSTP
jgi:hypothetical protein